LSVRDQTPTVAAFILEEIGVGVDRLSDAIGRIYHTSVGQTIKSDTIDEIIRRAEHRAIAAGDSFIGTEQLLFAALESTCPAVRLAFLELRLSLPDVIRRGEDIINELRRKGSRFQQAVLKSGGPQLTP
jgi:hypothetical protein